MDSIPYEANKVWNLLPESLKSSPLLTSFENDIKFEEYFECPCNLYMSYFSD